MSGAAKTYGVDASCVAMRWNRSMLGRYTEVGSGRRTKLRSRFPKRLSQPGNSNRSKRGARVGSSRRHHASIAATSVASGEASSAKRSGPSDGQGVDHVDLLAAHAVVHAVRLGEIVPAPAQRSDRRGGGRHEEERSDRDGRAEE